MLRSWTEDAHAELIKRRVVGSNDEVNEIDQEVIRNEIGDASGL